MREPTGRAPKPDQGLGAAVLLAPAVVVLAALTIVPAASVAVISLLRWTTFAGPAWAGLGNFRQLVGDSFFVTSLGVTARFVLGATLIELLVGVGVALLLEEFPRWRAGLRVLFALPLAFSPAVVGIVWRLALSEQGGPFWRLLGQVLGRPAHQLSSASGALATIVAIDVWQWTPLVVVIVSVALEGYKNRLAEIVRVDGIGRTTALWRIWAPLLAPALSMSAVLRAIDTIKVFDIVQTATAGGPGGASEVLSMYTYKQLVKFGDFGYAAATAVVLLALASLAWSAGARIAHKGWADREVGA